MNRILTFLTLVLVGFIISFLTGNILYSFFGCSLVSLALNRTGKPDMGFYPEEYLARFKKLKENVSSHDNDYDIYESNVLDAIFIDTDGNMWSLGLDSLGWYQVKNKSWVKATPKGKMILVSEYEMRADK